MTKEELSQLSYLNKEIELIKKQINDIEFSEVTDSVKGSSSEFPYTQHSIKIQGIDYKDFDKKVKSLKKKFSYKLNELMEIRDKINEYIESIKDSEMRIILTLRYINGVGWREIATNLYYQDESVPRKKHNRFLQMTEKSEK